MRLQNSMGCDSRRIRDLVYIEKPVPLCDHVEGPETPGHRSPSVMPVKSRSSIDCTHSVMIRFHGRTSASLKTAWAEWLGDAN